MSTLYFMIPAALALGGLFVWLFVWAVKNDQYEDLETPSHRILIDSEVQPVIHERKMK